MSVELVLEGRYVDTPINNQQDTDNTNEENDTNAEE